MGLEKLSDAVLDRVAIRRDWLCSRGVADAEQLPSTNPLVSETNQQAEPQADEIRCAYAVG